MRRCECFDEEGQDVLPSCDNRHRKPQCHSEDRNLVVYLTELISTMKSLLQCFVGFLVMALSTADTSEGGTILIEDFSKPIHKWSTMNDPVRTIRNYCYSELCSCLFSLIFLL